MNLLNQSKDKYHRVSQKVYDDFVKWKTKNGFEKFDEKVLITYFHVLSRKLKPPSLYAYHSMVKTNIKLHKNIDIGSYHGLTEFLKNQSLGYKPIKSKIFTAEEIHKFICEAPDSEWIDVKVVCIFSISGGLTIDELIRIKVGEVEKRGSSLLVRVVEKKKRSRSFTISGKFYDVVQKYAALRSPNTIDQGFFVNYRGGKCTIQLIGKNKIRTMAERIATFLKLPDPRRYTGNSLRQSSASILANAKRLELGEEYAEESVHYQKRIDGIFESSDSSVEETGRVIKLESDDKSDSESDFFVIEHEHYDLDKVKCEAEFIISDNEDSNTESFDMNAGGTEIHFNNCTPERRPGVPHCPQPDNLQDHSTSSQTERGPKTQNLNSQLDKIILPKSKPIGREIQRFRCHRDLPKASQTYLEKCVLMYKKKEKCQALSIDALRRKLRDKNRQIAKLRFLVRR